MLLLAQAVIFPEPVNDPWFLAQYSFTQNASFAQINGSDTATYYISADPLAVVGCTEQHQICNLNLPHAKGCTALSGLNRTSVQDTFEELSLNSRQRGIIRRLYDTFWTSFLATVAENLGSRSMLAADYLSGWSSTPLPSNQWILELQNWFAIIFNNMQLEIAQYVMGYGNPDYVKYIQPPSSDETWMCTNQIVQRNDYASFSILGLVIIFTFGALFIIIDMSLTTLIKRLRPDTRRSQDRKLEWTLYELLQLQRMAYEGYGIGTWSGQTDLVPVTMFGEKFSLPSTNPPTEEEQEKARHGSQ